MVVGPLANPLESSSTTLTSSPLLGERGSLLMVTTLVPANTAIGWDMHMLKSHANGNLQSKTHLHC